MFTLLFNLLWRRTSHNSNNKFSLYIKTNHSFPIPIEIDKDWKIQNVKDHIAPKLGLAPERLMIIFAGRALDDARNVQECNLAEKSVIHIVESSRSDRKLSTGFVEDETQVAPEAQTNFYVYCSTCGPALDGRPRMGKLRVRCSACKSGAIEVTRDPSSWTDVLEPNKINGFCLEADCPAGASAMVEFFTKCSEHLPSSGKEEQAIPLYLIRSNDRNIPCLACFDVQNPVLVFPCSDGHTTCLHCFVTYCTSKLLERSFVLDNHIGYTVPCPVGCRESFITAPHHFKLLPPYLYEQYKKFGVEDYVLKNGGYLCPKPGCGEGILTEEPTNKIKCTSLECQFEFCKLCLQSYHTGVCEDQEIVTMPETTSRWFPIDIIKAGKACWEEKATKWTIKKSTKPCPNCKVATERDGGCMHIYCTRCGLDWCWLCNKEWSNDCRARHWFG